MVLRAAFKPLSVNEVWQGRRYKTPKYKDYEKEVMYLIKSCPTPLFTPLQVEYTFHLKNANRLDVDNLIKPLQDILCKLGYFKDDRQIQRIVATKIKAAEDVVEVRIEPYQSPSL